MPDDRSDRSDHPSEPGPEELGLDALARRTLDLEASWWRYAGTKEAAIREVFDEEPASYFRRLGRVLDDPRATDYAPVLVRRLRRQRTRRIGSRSGRRMAG